MRSFISAIAVALILAAGAVGYGIYVEKTADELNEYTDRIESAIDRGEFALAGSAAQEMIGALDAKKEILGAIANHEEIYEIQKNLAELVCYAEDSDRAESRTKCAAVVAILERLSGNSSPALFNIL